MAEYLGGIIATSAVVAFCTMIAKDGANDGMSRTAMGVILLFAVMTPTVSLIDGMADFDVEDITGEYEDGGESLYDKTAEGAFCEGVRKLVCAEYSLSADEVEVHAFGFDVTKMCAEKIKIILTGGAAYSDSRGISAYVRECGLGECEVAIEITG